MLGDRNATATVAVKDLKSATRFYEETLGLSRVHTEGDEAVNYRTGSTTLLVYQSELARTNEATAVTWTLGGDIDRVVSDLKKKGVRFEHYDMPQMKREGDIHVAGDMRAAWFKDPDGNIHALISE